MGNVGEFLTLSGRRVKGVLKATSRAQVVGVTSTPVLTANPMRVWAILSNEGAGDGWFNLGNAAIINTGGYLAPYGGSLQIDQHTPWDGPVYMIGNAAFTCDITEVEVEERG